MLIRIKKVFEFHWTHYEIPEMSPQYLLFTLIINKFPIGLSLICTRVGQILVLAFIRFVTSRTDMSEHDFPSSPACLAQPNQKPAQPSNANNILAPHPNNTTQVSYARNPEGACQTL